MQEIRNRGERRDIKNNWLDIKMTSLNCAYYSFVDNTNGETKLQKG